MFNMCLKLVIRRQQGGAKRFAGSALRADAQDVGSRRTGGLV
jgi:hypothetical protein